MKVWIAYSQDAATTAEELRAALRTAGIDADAGVGEILPGDSLAARITSLVESADAIIVLFSKRSATSTWVGTEVALAVQQAKRIIPVIVEAGAEVPILLRDRLHVDFTKRLDRYSQFGAIIRALGTPESHSALPARVEALQAQRAMLELERVTAEGHVRSRHAYVTLLTITPFTTAALIGIALLLSGAEAFAEHSVLASLTIAGAVSAIANTVVATIIHKRVSRSRRTTE